MTGGSITKPPICAVLWPSVPREHCSGGTPAAQFLKKSLCVWGGGSSRGGGSWRQAGRGPQPVVLLVLLVLLLLVLLLLLLVVLLMQG